MTVSGCREENRHDGRWLGVSPGGGESALELLSGAAAQLCECAEMHPERELCGLPITHTVTF